MSAVYNLAVHITSFFLKLLALFKPKIRLFINGRKEVFDHLREQLHQDGKVIWVHTASLGEFEQGLPIMEKLRAARPDFKLLVTFFSPSGYEVKKTTSQADVVCYLPLDTKGNAKKFLDHVKPSIAIFVKYEIWPNYLHELEKRQVPAFLISAIFKTDQIYFKWYGGFMRTALQKFSKIFVQNEASIGLLNSIEIDSAIVSGDTRFDRVSEILGRDNTLDFMTGFKGKSPCFVAGSTWPEDEAILVDYINNTEKDTKFILAPHNIKESHIQELKNSISKKTLLYSQMEGKELADFNILIVDNIGLLTKIYSYAKIAYVGGAFATGLHNTLEPAVFGIPVIIGPDYKGFKEAEELVEIGGISVIRTKKDFNDITDQLLEDEPLRKHIGNINSSYINKNKGASFQIMEHILTFL